MDILMIDLTDAIKLCTGMTNDVYIKDNKIIRVFGGQDLIDRKVEEEIMTAASEQKLGPIIYESTPIYRIEEYLHPSITLTNKHMCSIDILKMIADRLRTFHTLKRPIGRPVLKSRLDKWSRLSGIDLPVNLLTGLVVDNVVLAHNDLVCSNILLYKDTIYFIDMEYAGYNYLEFDIANMFCEMELDQSLQCPISSQLLLAVQELQRSFCIFYMGDIHDGLHLYSNVYKYKPVVHFLWTMWAKIKGYADYREMRYKLFVELINKID